MTPNIKCTCPFGKPEVAIAENCPVHSGLKNDYPLIPMSEITDEARIIAVAWMEEDDRTFIANKHKLASDIMNYARRYNEKHQHDWKQKYMSCEEDLTRCEKENEKLLLEHLAQLNTLAKQADVVRQQYEKQLAFKDEEIKMLKHLRHE